MIISVGNQKTSAVEILSRAAREFPLIAVGLCRLNHGEIAPFYNTVTRTNVCLIRRRLSVPVWSRNSCGRSVVELQEPPEPLAASHGPILAHLLARKEEEVVLPLVIPLAVEVFDIGAQRGS